MCQSMDLLVEDTAGKVMECLCSDDALLLAGAVLVVSVCGALGGISGGLYRKKCGHNPSLVTKVDILTFAMSGIICAYGVILFGAGIANMFSQVGNYVKAFYLIGLSVVAGFFAMRLIPRIGSKLEQKIEQQFDVFDDKINRVSKAGQDIMVYQRMLSACQVALDTEEQADIDAALELLKKNLGIYARDRMLNIYYGRLLRRKRDLKGAIGVLRNYIDLMLKGIGNARLTQEEKTAVSVAYYNIACYHSLLIEDMPHERDRLVQETKDALSASHCFSAGIAKEWQADADLKAFREVAGDFQPGT